MINDVFDYLGSVALRQRLENLLDAGHKEFSGYASELFERGLRNRIKNLNELIDEYEVIHGYSLLAPRDHWLRFVRAEILPMDYVRVPTLSSLGSGDARFSAKNFSQSVPALGQTLQMGLFGPDRTSTIDAHPSVKPFCWNLAIV